MIETLALIKIGGIAASLVGAWGTWRTMPGTKTRSQLRRCFDVAGLYWERKKDKKIFPIVKRVVLHYDYVHVEFSLPHGVDPKEVHKNLWAFQQQFGEHITIEGDVKHFSMNIYGGRIGQYEYDAQEIMEAAKDLKLPIVAGKSREGYVLYDMVHHPHLLIAGETGAGKSTALRAILTFLVEFFGPDELHLYMADLKRSEFHLFNRLPHVKANEIDEKKVVKMLTEIDKELTRRGNLLNKAEVAHIDDLETKVPYIIVCIDEFALLKHNNAAMEYMETISSIGRALGVFLILSCLRPDADVMDGKLKNNLTVRMAFRASDEINSRIILGTGGAEQIKNSETGLMLFKFDGIKRVQAPYLDLKRAKRLLEPYKKKMPSGPIVDVEHHVVEEEPITGVLE